MPRTAVALYNRERANGCNLVVIYIDDADDDDDDNDTAAGIREADGASN